MQAAIVERNVNPAVVQSGPGNPEDLPEGHVEVEMEALPRNLVSGSSTRPSSAKLKNQTNATHRMRASIQFAALCWCLYLAGWNDGTTGPLLPRIQSVYDVSFVLVSLIFVFGCIGCVLGAFANLVLDRRYGFGKAIVLGSALQIIAYCIQAPALPFPAFVLSYVINGIGMALQDAQANGFVASSQDNAEVKMGILHAAYGAGALSSPLVATQFAQLPHWSFHYLVSLGMATLNTIFLVAVFRFKTQDECLAEIGQPASDHDVNERGYLRRLLGLKDVHLLAFFVLVYVGVEGTMGGWIVTYIIDVRRGGPSSGYISSGFFGGLMIGRVALLWVNRKVGERRVLFLYAFIAIGFELVIWLVPSLIGGAVSVSIVGLLLGPMYPIAMNHAGRVLPRRLLTSSIGWIAGFGQAGSAVLPFMTGAIASRFGIAALQPLLVAMMATMTFIWAVIPKGVRRTD